MQDIDRYVSVIEDFIKTEVNNSRMKGVVLGVSGGIDSAVVAGLASRALGPKNVLGIFMPAKVTVTEDYKHVEALQKQFGFEMISLHIGEISEAFLGTVNEKDPSNTKKMEIANIFPRIRMTILYYHANKKKSLVIGTSNKTEILIGYSTKFGDSAADINPIGDLYKFQIREIAKNIGVPSEIIEKPPTAGLWKGQTDEEEIGMSYNQLDNILMGLEKFETIEEIAKELDIELKMVNKIQDRINASEHKGRLAKILKLGYRTPTIDWRIKRV